MKHLLTVLSLLLGVMLCSSCQSDSETDTPALQTEIVMVQTNVQGVVSSFDTDYAQHYQVVNQLCTSIYDSLFRCLCVYVDEGEGLARVQQLKLVPLLSSLFAGSAKHDPTGVQSIWMTPSYLNLHLYPKTKGGAQKWGYIQDSTSRNALGGTTYFLSLYHHQLQDTAAFSTHFYASIPLDSIAAQHSNKDSLRFSIVVASGQNKTWTFGF